MPLATEKPPAQPETPEMAEAWLAWARTHHHAEGCQCHGCIRARTLIAARDLEDRS